MSEPQTNSLSQGVLKATVFNMLLSIHFDPGCEPAAADDVLSRLMEAGSALPGIRTSAAGKTLAHHLNGGSLLWRVAFESELDYRNALTSTFWCDRVAPVLSAERGVHTDHLTYKNQYGKTSANPGPETIWRCLIVAFDGVSDCSTLRRFEHDMLLMPQYVTVIRSWALSRVASATGARRWAYVWEQEFASSADLNGEYLTHPIHWGVIDGWYNPESHHRIFDEYLIHAAIPIKEAVIV